MVVANKSVEQDTTYELLQDVQLYYMPILVHLGFLGNCLSVCVFFGTKLRHSSSSIYLGALAISDSGFLLTVFVVWLNMVHISLFNESGFCQLFIYVGTFSSFLSVWLVMAFTIERYMAVKYPLRRQSLCTVARAKLAVIGLTVLAVLISSPVLLFSESRKFPTADGNITLCYLAEGWDSWATIYNGIDTVLTFAVPLTIIVIFNVLIARNIYQFNHVRRTLTIESDVSNISAHNRDRMPQTKVTKMLLLVSSAFLCLNMPAFVLRVVVFLYYDHESSSSRIILAQQMSNMLFNTSFGINFILYCASGHNFRRAMIRMFMRRSTASRSGTLIQMANHEKRCEFTHKWSTTKRPYLGDNVQKDSQETQKLQINERLKH